MSDDGRREAGRGRRRAVVCLAIGLGLLIAAYVPVLLLSQPRSPGTELRYDEFLADLSSHRVHSATVLVFDRRIVGVDGAGIYWVSFGTTVEGNPAFSTLLDRLTAANVPVDFDQQWAKGLTGPLLFLLPSLVLADALILVFLLTRGEGSRGAFGRSGSRRVGKRGSGALFADIAGIDEVVEELAEIKDFLRSPARFAEIGARVPRGVLLVGPPGCGKTLLARAVAGEAGVPFFSIAGSDFVEMFVGVGAARIRDLFREAQEASPAIVFIDELDAVGRGRSTIAVAGQDEREATLNQLLVGLDGFEAGSGVIVLAATNRADVLDSALLRPGRFDRRIHVPLPDVRGRLEILRLHLRGKRAADGLDLNSLARQCAGFSGADLASIVNEAALLAGRRHEPAISQALLSEAMERVLMGPERRSKVISARDKMLIAHHEAGHAMAATVRCPEQPVSKISIVSRGTSGGFTWLSPDVDAQVSTRPDLEARLIILMSGRVAEELAFGHPTSGAENDLARATDLARRMVCDWGMSERVGPISLTTSRSASAALDRGVPTHSEELSSLIDNEVRGLLETARSEARTTLVKHWAQLSHIATRLQEVESLEGDQLDSLLHPPVSLTMGS